MKKIFKSILYFSVLAISTTSCTDLLTEKPDSYLDQNTFFTSVANAEMSVIGIYDVFAKEDHYGQFEMAMPTSDDMYHITPSSQTDNSRRDISHYMLSTSNAWVNSLWNNKYKGLDRANFTLESIRNMDLYKEGNEALLSLEGEACFLRAFIAFDLVKYWGDVPFKTTYTKTVEEAYQPRTNREAIYDQMVEDLTIAINQLKWSGDSGCTGERTNQGAARGLLMRVLMHRAGYSLQMDGSLTRPDDATRQKYFTEVIKQFEAIEANGFHKFLTDGYKQLWVNYSAEVLQPSESLFEIALYTPDGKKEDAGTWGSYIGPEVDANSSYGRANAFFRVLPEWYDFYAEGDVRRDVNICKYKIDAKNNKIENKPSAWYPGKWRREWMSGAPKDPNNTDVNIVILRYADLVLLAAEAYNELGNTSEALRQLNRVRERAGVAPITEDMANYATFYKKPQVKDLTYIDDSSLQGKIRTALYWERGFELCFEGSRKNDLIRWGILEDAIQFFGSFTKSAKSYKAKDYYEKGKHELFPVPLNEIDINHKLNGVNNPNY